MGASLVASGRSNAANAHKPTRHIIHMTWVEAPMGAPATGCSQPPWIFVAPYHERTGTRRTSLRAFEQSNLMLELSRPSRGLPIAGEAVIKLDHEIGLRRRVNTSGSCATNARPHDLR
jgi:hypothetical protein